MTLPINRGWGLLQFGAAVEEAKAWNGGTWMCQYGRTRPSYETCMPKVWCVRYLFHCQSEPSCTFYLDRLLTKYPDRWNPENCLGFCSDTNVYALENVTVELSQSTVNGIRTSWSWEWGERAGQCPIPDCLIITRWDFRSVLLSIGLILSKNTAWSEVVVASKSRSSVLSRINPGLTRQVSTPERVYLGVPVTFTSQRCVHLYRPPQLPDRGIRCRASAKFWEVNETIHLYQLRHLLWHVLQELSGGMQWFLVLSAKTASLFYQSLWLLWDWHVPCDF